MKMTSWLWLSLFSSTTFTLVVGQTNFTGCDVATYYSSLPTDVTTWTRAILSKVLESTHRNILPVQNDTGDDIYKALIDLWPGDIPGSTVFLAYRNQSYPALPYANTQYWSRANIWPDERIPDVLEEAENDIHANVPVDSNVIEYKLDNFLGECGTVENADLCKLVDETTATFTDGKVWQPPDFARGSQARMALYMATRYFEQVRNNATYTLGLSSCPPFGVDTMGYLATLLKWHAEYPPTPAEIARNERICTRWQGTRNPFIDFPQLASILFGEPDVIPEGFYSFSECIQNSTVATDEPTATPNGCSSVEPGDVQVILVNSDDPNQIGFFTLANIPATVDYLYVTDKPFNGQSFVQNDEGTIRIKVPDSTTGKDGRPCGGWCPGSLFSYGFAADAGKWEDVAGTFDLSIAGDTILTYCMDANNRPHFIHGLSYAEGGAWAAPGLSDAEYGTDKSALPSALALQGSVALGYNQNIIYSGETNAIKSALVQYYRNASSYTGSNTIRYTIKELDPTSEGTATLTMGYVTMVIGAALWWIMMD